MRTGEVVIVYDEFLKRVFWRLGKVTELLTGSDGITRAAIVKTVNSECTRFLHRSIKHLIPIDLSLTLKRSIQNSHKKSSLWKQMNRDPAPIL